MVNTRIKKKRPDNLRSLRNFLRTSTLKQDSLINIDHREFLFQSYEKFSLIPGIGEPNNNMQGFLSRETRRKSLQLLCEKMLKHKWGDAAVVLESLVEVKWAKCKVETDKHPEVIRRVGCEILLNSASADGSDNLLSSHKRSMGLHLRGLDHVHVLLEYVFSFFAKHDFTSVQENLSTYNLHKITNNPHNKLISLACWTPSVEGYLGLAEYAMWRLTIAQEPSNSFQSSIDSHEDSVLKHQNIAEAATEHFKKLLNKPGAWDIFVMKHIEILLYYYQFDSLKKDLTLYSESHLENPNAHKYLYQVLRSYIVDDSEEIQNLKVVALRRLQAVSPSDALMVCLHQLLLDKSFKSVEKSFSDDRSKQFLDLIESFEVVMQLLDFSSPDKECWCILCKHLKITRERLNVQQFTSLVDSLWNLSGRNSWWPKFHFSSLFATQNSSENDAESEVFRSKLYLASVFISSSQKFWKTARKHGIYPV